MQLDQHTEIHIRHLNEANAVYVWQTIYSCIYKCLYKYEEIIIQLSLNSSGICGRKSSGLSLTQCIVSVLYDSDVQQGHMICIWGYSLVIVVWVQQGDMRFIRPEGGGWGVGRVEGWCSRNSKGSKALSLAAWLPYNWVAKKLYAAIRTLGEVYQILSFKSISLLPQQRGEK